MNSKTILLTILTGKNRVLLNLVQGLAEIDAWMFLTFFMCLHN